MVPTLELLKAYASKEKQKRDMIPPRVEVQATSAVQKQELVKIAREVIAEHRDVLMALKDR